MTSLKGYISELESYQEIKDVPQEKIQPLVTWLISQELQPGGPYVSSTPTTEALLVNLHAVRLFSSDEYPLSGALSFLNKHRDMLEKLGCTYPSTKQPLKPTVGTAAIYSDIAHTIKTAYASHAAPALKVLAKIQTTDTLGEISTLSSSFAKSLSITLPEDIAIELGRANIYTWIAYTLYDTIYDSHTLRTMELIPIANCILQRATSSFLKAKIPSETFQKLFMASDLAHLEEVQSCRFNQKLPINAHAIPQENMLRKLLPERSIAHCIGPVHLFQHTYPHKVKEQSTLAHALRAYCGARQLLDDIHDWQDDLITGKWTYVTAYLIRGTPSFQRSPLAQHSLHTLLPEAKQVFWNQGITRSTEYALSQVSLAEKLFGEILQPKNKHHFLDITLGPIKKSLLASQDEASQAQKLISSLFN